jgi:hypothetical protein
MKHLIEMKKIIIQLSILTIVILFTSCDKTWYDDWVILNDTEYLVEVYAYDTDREDDLFDDSFVIQPNSEHKVPKGRSGVDADYQGIFKNPDADSVAIIFNNERIIIQICDYDGSDDGRRYGAACQFPRNIMDFYNREDYIKTEINRNSYRFTYTITQADYERAVPIEAK